MGWKRLRRLAAISLGIGVVSACGGAARVESVADAGSSISAATKTSDPTMSVGYCQLLDNGQWVTNESAHSTTPCVPDPSYATGDEEVDASVALPRCYTCTLSDWKSAERRAAVRASAHSASSTEAVDANSSTGLVDEWSADIYRGFISNCSVTMSGSLCECLANHLEWRVPADQAQGLSADDPRVVVAGRDCQS